MKVYQYKYNEILIIESLLHLHEERLADAYNELFDQLLLPRNISDKKLYQLIDIYNNKITSAPHIVKAVLMKDRLPEFKFLSCKN